jgi:MFS transporter, DHA2 family, multidrug resistance protein
VRTGVIAGVGVALHVHSAALLDSVRAAFSHGLDVMLAVCAGTAGLSALLALAFLPRRAQAGARPAGGPDVAAVTGSGAPLAPPGPGGQDQGHEHARH